jgi:hypothetical protein
MGVLIGNCHLKGHPFKFRLTNNPTCETCLINGESAGHGLCDFEAVVYLRMSSGSLHNQMTSKTPLHNRSLNVAVQGPDFMAHPLYIQDTPSSNILHVIQSVGLLRG